jgi:hypothetical protein
MRKIGVFGLVLTLLFGLSACVDQQAGLATPAPTTSPASCPASGPFFDNGKVIAAFSTTIGVLRTFAPIEISPGAQNDRWPGVANDHPAVLCYLDADVKKGPMPSRPTDTAPPSFDRIIVVVLDGEVQPMTADYKDRLPVATP